MDQRPKTPEAYIELINQAIFEIDDLRAAVEYDSESMGGAIEFLGELDAHMKGLRKKMEEGTYRFEDKDLPFMEVVERSDERLLPFKYLLRMINATHRKGLNVDVED
jgi:hypothetical protein